jgi:7-carboxy-7-deazaguanine synthase (Cx14CxxC type)
VSYAVKEIYYTLQGEGANAGSPAVLLRFSGCNLWSGREEDRSTAICRFCDTDFRGTDGANGGKYQTAEGLADKVAAVFPFDAERFEPWVVCTGGEPLLQLDDALLAALMKRGFRIAIETNGTILLASQTFVNWITVSPKAVAPLKQTWGNELKLIYPQSGAEPERYEGLGFDHFFLQPMDGPKREENTTLAVRYCLDHPNWRLSVQVHKMLGLP